MDFTRFSRGVRDVHSLSRGDVRGCNESGVAITRKEQQSRTKTNDTARGVVAYAILSTKTRIIAPCQSTRSNLNVNAKSQMERWRFILKSRRGLPTKQANPQTAS